MLVTRIHGKPVVAYESIKEAMDHMSCITCAKWREDNVPCPVYSICREVRQPGDEPAMHILATREIIESRGRLI